MKRHVIISSLMIISTINILTIFHIYILIGNKYFNDNLYISIYLYIYIYLYIRFSSQFVPIYHIKNLLDISIFMNIYQYLINILLFLMRSSL